MEKSLSTMNREFFSVNDAADAHSDFVAEVTGVDLSFGAQHILDNISLSIKPGKAVLLRGDNGSGKSTLLNIIGGFLRPDKGRVHLRLNGSSVDVAATSPERLARLGVGRLWQDIRIFPTMSVIENVLAATPRLLGQNPLMAMAAWPISRRQERQARERAHHHLSLVGMGDRANSSGDKLSLGQMKRVALARLLQGGANLLLLDEPLAGLDQESAASLLETLKMLHSKGKTLLIVEHQHEKVSGLCDETWYLRGGKLYSNGKPS
jgi:branched-chain amino acid transport system ATP-binding protein